MARACASHSRGLHDAASGAPEGEKVERRDEAELARAEGERCTAAASA